MDVPYITCEMWMICPSHVRNYIDGNLLEDWEMDGNAGNLPRLIVGPSELLGPPGSSLLWSITQIKVL